MLDALNSVEYPDTSSNSSPPPLSLPLRCASNWTLRNCIAIPFMPPAVYGISTADTRMVSPLLTNTSSGSSLRSASTIPGWNFDFVVSINMPRKSSLPSFSSAMSSPDLIGERYTLGSLPHSAIAASSTAVLIRAIASDTPSSSGFIIRVTLYLPSENSCPWSGRAIHAYCAVPTGDNTLMKFFLAILEIL